MTGKVVSSILLAIFVVTAGGLATAQENGLARGAKSVSFAVPGGGGALVGARYFLQANGAVGLDFGYSAAIPEHGDSTAGFTVLPSYSYYLMTKERVAAYAKGALNITKIQGIDFSDAITMDLGAFFGVEFFVTKEFSLGGELGVAINFRNKFKTITSQTGTGSLSAQFFF